MAFPWQDDYEIKDIYDAVGGGIQLARAFTGRKKSKSAKRARKTAKRAAKLARAAADPTSPTFRNLAGQYDAENRRALIQGIDRIMRENARTKARGGIGFGINPERRDESRTQALARAFMKSREGARREARDTLLAASHGLTGSAGALPVAADEARSAQNFELLSSGVTGGAAFARKLQELFTGAQDRETSYSNYPSQPKYGYQRGPYGRQAGPV